MLCGTLWASLQVNVYYLLFLCCDRRVFPVESSVYTYTRHSEQGKLATGDADDWSQSTRPGQSYHRVAYQNPASLSIFLAPRGGMICSLPLKRREASARNNINNIIIILRYV